MLEKSGVKFTELASLYTQRVKIGVVWSEWGQTTEFWCALKRGIHSD